MNTAIGIGTGIPFLDKVQLGSIPTPEPEPEPEPTPEPTPEPEPIVDFTKGGFYPNQQGNITKDTINFTHIGVTTNSYVYAWEQQVTYAYDFAENTLEVSGIPDGLNLYLYPDADYYSQGNGILLTNGTIIVPAVSESEAPVFAYLITNPDDYEGDVDITIKQVVE